MGELSPWHIRPNPKFGNLEGYAYSEDPPDSGSFHLRNYWRILVKWRRVIFISFFVIFIVGSYFGLTATSLYTANAILKIEPKNPATTMIGDLPTFSITGGDYDYYQTLFVLLRGRGLATRVIAELDLASDSGFTGSRIATANPVNRMLPYFEREIRYGTARATEMFGHICKGVRFLLSRLDVEMVGSWLQCAESEERPSASGRRQPVTSGKGTNSVPPWMVGRYRSFLKVRPVAKTRLVQISFTTPIPSLSERLANAHVDAFIRMNLESSFDLTKEAREFLEKKKSELNDKVARSERVLNNFRKKHGVLSLNKGENVLLDRLLEFNKELTRARANRIEMESLYRSIEGKPPESIAEVMQDSLVLQYKNNVASLSSERTRLSTIFKEGHPRLADLDKQIAALILALNTEIQNVTRRLRSSYLTAFAKETRLKEEADKLKKAALDLKELAIDYTVLADEVNTNRALYESILQRLSQAAFANDITVSNIQATEYAELPGSPSGPNTSRSILLSVAFGLFFGIATAFALEYFDSTIRSPDDVRRTLPVPILGIVPHLRSLRRRWYGYTRLSRRSPAHGLAHPGAPEGKSFKTELLVSHHPLSILSECYRSIRTGVLLSLSQLEGCPKVTLISSAQPGEGKTMTAVNLAISMAQTGKSVVLVDADLRRGNCHTLLGAKNGAGLTELLAGLRTLEDSLKQTDLAGLYLLPRGSVPPNPPDLLGDHRMREVLEALRKRFDSVLIDSPPALVVSDALLLSTVADGVLLVIRAETTTVDLARTVFERFQSAYATILGVVLNGVDIRKAEFYNYKQFYYSYYTSVQRSRELETT